MDQSPVTRNKPTALTWILAALIVLAIVWTVFALIARKQGSQNQTLPRAHIAGAAMVARAASVTRLLG